MRNEEFKFQRFTVRQERCAMKVGTDGVLLGAWAGGASRILDAGTGTGLIALMMAQRFPDAVVDAVEIDHGAAEQARENAGRSPFAGRVNVFETSLQDYAKDYDGIPYGAIVSNPPYFNDSLKNPDGQRTLARHTDSLPYCDLFRSVDTLLDAGGVFSAVIPCSCKEDFMAEAAIFGFFPIRETFVHTISHKPPKRCLLAFSRKRAAEVKREEVAMMHSGNTKSSWYAGLTRDFYLVKD